MAGWAGWLSWLAGLVGWVGCWLGWLVGWLAGLAGWAGWLGWLAGLAGWLVGWVGWLAGWLAGWLVGWLAGWLAGWLVGCSGLVFRFRQSADPWGHQACEMYLSLPPLVLPLGIRNAEFASIWGGGYRQLSTWANISRKYLWGRESGGIKRQQSLWLKKCLCCRKTSANSQPSQPAQPTSPASQPSQPANQPAQPAANPANQPSQPTQPTSPTSHPATHQPPGHLGGGSVSLEQNSAKIGGSPQETRGLQKYLFLLCFSTLEKHSKNKFRRHKKRKKLKCRRGRAD